MLTDAERATRRDVPALKVDGRVHPELFFRFELFDELVTVFCPADTHRGMKAAWSSEMRSLGIDDTLFWKKLQQSLGTYRSPSCARSGVVRPEHGLEQVRVQGLRGEGEITFQVDRQLCRSRFAAFQAARRAIGPDTLDEVLYGLVAPRESISYSSSDRHYADKLLYIEEGCR